ncbi:MAG: GntR family transcriptional regulator [Prevotella sp.]
MIFSNDKAIYIQMADRLCDDILAGTYADDDRIPSVREYSVALEVNINTAVKAYDLLARDGIIYNRRGLGYFVKGGARQLIMQTRRHDFMENVLPGMFRNMRLLGIGIDDIQKAWNESEPAQASASATNDTLNY